MLSLTALLFPPALGSCADDSSLASTQTSRMPHTHLSVPFRRRSRRRTLCPQSARAKSRVTMHTHLPPPIEIVVGLISLRREVRVASTMHTPPKAGRRRLVGRCQCEATMHTHRRCRRRLVGRSTLRREVRVASTMRRLRRRREVRVASTTKAAARGESSVNNAPPKARGESSVTHRRRRQRVGLRSRRAC